MHVVESNCTHTAVDLNGVLAIGKGIGVPSNAKETRRKQIGAASSSSTSSSSLCPSSESSDASLDGARVGSRSLATGKGIGLYRRVVPAPQPEPVESNSGLAIEFAPALLVGSLLAQLRALGVEINEQIVGSSPPERLAVALQELLNYELHSRLISPF